MTLVEIDEARRVRPPPAAGVHAVSLRLTVGARAGGRTRLQQIAMQALKEQRPAMGGAGCSTHALLGRVPPRSPQQLAAAAATRCSRPDHD